MAVVTREDLAKLVSARVTSFLRLIVHCPADSRKSGIRERMRGKKRRLYRSDSGRCRSFGSCHQTYQTFRSVGVVSYRLTAGQWEPSLRRVRLIEKGRDAMGAQQSSRRDGSAELVPAQTLLVQSNRYKTRPLLHTIHLALCRSATPTAAAI